MILFLNLVFSVFIVDELISSPNNYINMSKSVVNIGDFDHATDLTIKEGSNPANSIMIKNNKLGVVFDQSGGGIELIAWPPNYHSNEKYFIILTPENKFIIMNRGKCLKYVSDKKKYITDTCNNSSIAFKLFFESTIVKKKYSFFQDNRRIVEDFVHKIPNNNLKKTNNKQLVNEAARYEKDAMKNYEKELEKKANQEYENEMGDDYNEIPYDEFN